jgi:uncharacterized DUF497 family protein
LLDNLHGFDWDVANVKHILRHKVSPFEVEEAAALPHIVIPGRTVAGEPRWQMFGKSAAGRYLTIVFTARRKLFRAVTAYPMNATERKRYGPQIP